MIELLVQFTGKLPRTYTKIKDIEREITVPIPYDYTDGDIQKIRPRGWGKYFKDSIHDYRRVIRVRGIKRRWETAVLLEPLRDEHGKVLQRRRYYIDMKKIPRRKLKKKIFTLRSLKGMLVDKDNH